MCCDTNDKNCGVLTNDPKKTTIKAYNPQWFGDRWGGGHLGHYLCLVVGARCHHWKSLGVCDP